MPSFTDIFLPWRQKIQETEPAKETTYPCVSVPQMTATILQPVKSSRAAVVNPALVSHSYPPRYYPSRPPSKHVAQRPNRQVPLVVPPPRNESRQVVAGPMKFQAKDIPTLRPLWPERAQVESLRTELGQLEKKVVAAADRQELSEREDIFWKEKTSSSLNRLQCSLGDVTGTVSTHTERLVDLEKMLDMLPAFRGGTSEEKYEMVDIAVQQLTNKVECLLSNMFAEKETNHKLLEILKKQYEESVGQEAKIVALNEQLERYQAQTLPKLEVVDRAPVSDMRVFGGGYVEKNRCTRSFSRVADNILLFGVLSVEGSDSADASLELAQHIQCENCQVWTQVGR
ncbi:MAG: uncharacterized protein KVP18_001359 [Porospora cf. gigantea A]|uniref:uncharacterized protein n=1 Tax=Porospora cf. gigantea A TaxID=2853593 RepID=UPI003559AF7D|nr:MAG: hypothetical protein KVP18_001359 [Porospora cf. gigantea A]